MHTQKTSYCLPLIRINLLCDHDSNNDGDDYHKDQANNKTNLSLLAGSSSRLHRRICVPQTEGGQVGIRVMGTELTPFQCLLLRSRQSLQLL